MVTKPLLSTLEAGHTLVGVRPESIGYEEKRKKLERWYELQEFHDSTPEGVDPDLFTGLSHWRKV